MPKIVLHGDLEQFGQSFQLDVSTPAEAVRALCSQVRGFRRRIAQGNFSIVRIVKDKTRDLSVEMLTSVISPSHEIHITPVVAGSGGGGSGIMIGLAIIAAAFTFGAGAAIALGDFALAGTMMSATAVSIGGYGISYATIAGFGAAILFTGVSQMLSQTKKSTTQATNASFVFSGPANVTEQGSAIPLLYGLFIGGSVVGSSDMQSTNI